MLHIEGNMLFGEEFFYLPVALRVICSLMEGYIGSKMCLTNQPKKVLDEPTTETLRPLLYYYY
jgi:hypothetical protein